MKVNAREGHIEICIENLQKDESFVKYKVQYYHLR